MTDNIITIGRYDQAAYAHIDKGRLEAAGISAMVAQDNQPGLFVFHAVVGGSVELQVFERDAEAALAVLEAADHPAELEHAEDGVESEPASGDADERSEPESEAVTTCPQCGSTRLERVRMVWPWVIPFAALVLIVVSVLLAVTSILALFLVIYLGQRASVQVQCRDCRHRFRVRRSAHGMPGTRIRRGRGPVYW